ncbi:Hpt domain-containing protein [Spongiibacter sp. KMU-158]|uniref:Hpt domain-containing protein n=1 Tax=Spongiibacter pelagi TaxID=2760804 RepID=A0A927C1X7_9GAMM|nr:Hpt domain-containing protein [Spongiibacter pelagi]MBD2858372.1 Hpt domain-containing protein [Spongiibacter pelagi]
MAASAQLPRQARKMTANEKFAALQEEYLAKIDEKFLEISDSWLAYSESQGERESYLEKLYRHLHSMAGTSGILGIDEVSNLARKAENVLIGKKQLDDGEEKRVIETLAKLNELISQGQIVARTIDINA